MLGRGLARRGAPGQRRQSTDDIVVGRLLVEALLRDDQVDRRERKRGNVVRGLRPVLPERADDGFGDRARP